MERMRINSSIMIVLVALCVAANGALAADLDSSVPLEYQVKAAVVYKFVRYVEWSKEVLPDTLDTITLGVLGGSPMVSALRTLVEGKEVGGYTLRIRHFRSLEDLAFCHVLFVGRSEKEHLKEVLGHIEGWSTLTVGEAEGFAQEGGMINLVIAENRVKFEINLGAAEDADLKISSRLLRLGKIMGGKG